MVEKSNARCQCCNFPLIPSNVDKSKKTKCNLQHFITSDRTNKRIQSECQLLESYVFTNVICNIKVCNNFYKTFPTQNVTTIIPPY